MNILGIGGLLGHDANAALIMSNHIVASSQEERFSRIKHDASFPVQAIADCLKAGGLTNSDIQVVVLAEKPLQTYVNNQVSRIPSRLLQLPGLSGVVKRFTLSGYEREVERLFPNAVIKYSWHHLSHAISGYYSSPFDKAAFLCVDGKGEFASASIGFVDREQANITHELAYSNGLGMLYTLLTHFLGFVSFGSEYKVMGMAPYGRPEYVSELSKLFSEEENGALRLRKRSTFHPADLARLFPWVGDAVGFNSRSPGEELGPQHLDLAASLQVIFEDQILKMAAFARKKTGFENLIFCGGCGQNCVAAGKLRDSGIFSKVYNSPIGGDMGSGLGAALAYLHYKGLANRQELDFRGFYLGSSPGQVQEKEAIIHQVDLNGKDLKVFMAERLAEGKMIGWVQSGMELGARALGARSILANPLIPNIQSEMNQKIKFRESFRPFAPAILSEDVTDWFEVDQPSDYMQFTAFLREPLRYPTPAHFGSFREWLNYPRCKIPSVVHVDYSARLQTVSESEHPEFHRLLREFKALTGIPILINTSFNVNGQPIVRTADEAWECFLNTDVDLLVIEDKVYKNPFERSREDKLQWLKQFEKHSK